jgi:hypothetical protein
MTMQDDAPNGMGGGDPGADSKLGQHPEDVPGMAAGGSHRALELAVLGSVEPESHTKLKARIRAAEAEVRRLTADLAEFRDLAAGLNQLADYLQVPPGTGANGIMEATVEALTHPTARVTLRNEGGLVTIVAVINGRPFESGQVPYATLRAALEEDSPA